MNLAHTFFILLSVVQGSVLWDITSKDHLVGLTPSDLVHLTSIAPTAAHAEYPFTVCLGLNNQTLPLHERKMLMEDRLQRSFLPVFIDSKQTQQACFYTVVPSKELMPGLDKDYNFIAFPALLKVREYLNLI